MKREDIYFEVENRFRPLNLQSAPDPVRPLSSSNSLSWANSACFEMCFPCQLNIHFYFLFFKMMTTSIQTPVRCQHSALKTARYVSGKKKRICFLPILFFYRAHNHYNDVSTKCKILYLMNSSLTGDFGGGETWTLTIIYNIVSMRYKYWVLDSD